MGRLTEFWSGSWILSLKARGAGYDNYSVLERLAKYENTGLEPEEVAEMKSLCEKSYDGLRDRLRKAEQAVRWIPVSERFPKENECREQSTGELIPLLVCVKGTEYPFRAFYDGKAWGDSFNRIDVIYWMPLPQPPKGEHDGR